MAARVARTGGAGMGWAVTVVILGIATFAFMVFAIVQYVQVDELRASNAELERQLEVYVDSEDREAREIAQMRRTAENSNKTVVGLLRDEIELLRILISGDPERTAESIQAGMTQIAVEQEKGEPVTMGETARLIPTIEQLYVKLVEERKLKRDSQTREAQLSDQINELRQQLAQKTRDYDSAVSELTAKLATVQDDLDALREKTNQQRNELATDIINKEQTRAAQAEDYEQQIADLRARTRDLEKELADYRSRLGVPKLAHREEYAPDGEVLAVVADENHVHINVGRMQNVLLGMSFEVYDRQLATPRPPRDPITGETLPGKATIEVIKVEENRSICQVVRRASPIQRGDYIVNVVYDPERRYKFYVFGEFDIDQQGLPTDTDRRRVESMISQWNGSVADELSFETDFVVLGIPPELPTRQVDPSDLEAAQRLAELRRKYEEYQEVVGRALTLGKPILNQNRFLTLVGYYQR